MNVRKYEQRIRKTSESRGKKYEVRNMADIRAVSLDTNRKVAEIEDKPLSSVAGISPVRKGTSIVLRQIWSD